MLRLSDGAQTSTEVVDGPRPLVEAVTLTSPGRAGMNGTVTVLAPLSMTRRAGTWPTRGEEEVRRT
jgi:hypothetical protein